LIDAVLLSDFFAANPLIDFVDPDGPSGPEPATLDVRRLYGPAVDMLLSRTFADGTTDWYLTDMLGSVRLIVSPEGMTSNVLSYDPFGNVADETNPAGGDRFKWTGRESIPMLSLQFNRARFYSPQLGVWQSADPIGHRARDPNLFRYAFNRPVWKTDLRGLWESSADAKESNDLVNYVVQALVIYAVARQLEIYMEAWRVAWQAYTNISRPHRFDYGPFAPCWYYAAYYQDHLKISGYIVKHVPEVVYKGDNGVILKPISGRGAWYYLTVPPQFPIRPPKLKPIDPEKYADGLREAGLYQNKGTAGEQF
jgi:RHS repeat-associated protein